MKNKTGILTKQNDSTRAILLDIELEGKGIVNFDGDDQKFIHPKMKGQLKMNNNTKLAKKNFYKNEDGELEYKIKISSDCLKHAIFGDDLVSKSPNIIHNPNVLYSYVSSPTAISTGYLFPDKKETLKKSSSITICDAEQVCNAESHIELHSRSGKKTIHEDEQVKDNTLFNCETVGAIKYKSTGTINLVELGFVSCDQVFDRYSLNPDYYPMYKEFLKMRMPDFDSNLGYYQLDNSCVKIPELGFLFSEKNVQFLVKEQLKKILSTRILRRNSDAHVTKLKIKLVNDCTQDLLADKNGWIELKSKSDIDSLVFNPAIVYSRVDSDIANKLRADIDTTSNASSQERSDYKKEQKAQRDAKKGKK